MKKARLLQLVLALLLVSVQVPGVYAKDPKFKNENSATFTYTKDDFTSDYGFVKDLVNEFGPTVTGEVWMYNDASHLFIYAFVRVKPYLAYGELDKDYDRTLDDITKDRDDLRSDGIVILELGDPYYVSDDKEKGYRWFVGPLDSNKGKRRDPEIDVPSWNANLGPGGILDTTIIEYFAVIPIADVEAAVGPSPWVDIFVEVHASPNIPVPEFVIPEVPFGTIGALVAFFAALGVTAIRKK